ncbi:hypothetical protein HK098_005891, partial [Nowakowskiella sp. JEL0407]
MRSCVSGASCVKDLNSEDYKCRAISKTTTSTTTTSKNTCIKVCPFYTSLPAGGICFTSECGTMGPCETGTACGKDGPSNQYKCFPTTTTSSCPTGPSPWISPFSLQSGAVCRGPCGPTGVCVRGTTCTQESVSKLFVCAPDGSITSPATTTTTTPCPGFSPRLLGPGEICQNWCGNKGACNDGLTCKLDAATLEYKCSANTITTTTTVSPVVTSPVDVPIGNQ